MEMWKNHACLTIMAPRACCKCILAVLFFPNINNRPKIEKLKNICELTSGKTNAISGGRGGGVFPRFLNIDTEGALCKIMITYKVADVKTLQ